MMGKSELDDMEDTIKRDVWLGYRQGSQFQSGLATLHLIKGGGRATPCYIYVCILYTNIFIKKNITSDTCHNLIGTGVTFNSFHLKEEEYGS